MPSRSVKQALNKKMEVFARYAEHKLEIEAEIKIGRLMSISECAEYYVECPPGSRPRFYKRLEKILARIQEKRILVDNFYDLEDKPMRAAVLARYQELLQDEENILKLGIEYDVVMDKLKYDISKKAFAKLITARVEKALASCTLPLNLIKIYQRQALKPWAEEIYQTYTALFKKNEFDLHELETFLKACRDKQVESMYKATLDVYARQLKIYFGQIELEEFKRFFVQTRPYWMKEEILNVLNKLK